MQTDEGLKEQFNTGREHSAVSDSLIVDTEFPQKFPTPESVRGQLSPETRQEHVNTCDRTFSAKLKDIFDVFSLPEQRSTCTTATPSGRPVNLQCEGVCCFLIRVWMV